MRPATAFSFVLPPSSFFPSYRSCKPPTAPVPQTRADTDSVLVQPSRRSPPTFRAGESSHISRYESSVGSTLVDPSSRAESTAQLGREDRKPQPEQPRGIRQDNGLIRSAAEVARLIAEWISSRLGAGTNLGRQSMGGQPESPREPHALGETHDLMPLIPPTACRMQSRLALITRRPRLVVETLAESRLAVNIMTHRICSRQLVCDLGKDGTSSTDLASQLLASRTGEASRRRTACMRIRCHLENCTFQPVQANLTQCSGLLIVRPCFVEEVLTSCPG